MPDDRVLPRGATINCQKVSDPQGNLSKISCLQAWPHNLEQVRVQKRRVQFAIEIWVNFGQQQTLLVEIQRLVFPPRVNCEALILVYPISVMVLRASKSSLSNQSFDWLANSASS